jgi:hypothetical protein
MNGHAFSLAVSKRAAFGKAWLVSKALKRRLGVEPQQTVYVEFEVLDESHLEMVEELSIGKQRGLLHYIASAKSEATRTRRAIDVIQRGLSGQLFMQRS